MTRPALFTMEQRILKRLNCKGGASRADLTTGLVSSHERTLARNTLDALVAAGKVFRYTRPAYGGRGCRAQQFFLNKLEGETWAGMQPQPKIKTPRVREKHIPLPHQALTVSPKRPDFKAGPSVLDKTAPVVIPAGVTVQKLPGFPTVDARFQCASDMRIVGGFASMGIGKYLED